MRYVLEFASPLLNLLRDMLFVVFSVRTIRSNRSLTPRRVLYAAAALSCVATIILFGNSLENLATVVFLMEEVSDLFFALFRSAVRFICYYAYIRTLKHISRATAAYDALLMCTVSLAAHNLFLTPITRPILNANVNWTSHPGINALLCLLVVNVCTILIYYLVYRLIPLGQIKNAGPSRMAILFLLAAASWYLNGSLKDICGLPPGQVGQFSLYLMVIQLLLLVCLGYIERYQRTSADYMRATMENQFAHSLLDNIKLQSENDELIRHMRHDLRNHLISLRQLISDERREEALQYLDSLYQDHLSFQPRIKTGNLILDGILIQKMGLAEKDRIAFSVASDFSFLDAMNDADMCVLFGNLLDNALEACREVDAGCRYINIRGSLVGEIMLYIIENSCSRDIAFESAVPPTTKADRTRHGIGLTSVTRVMKKYHGTIAFSCKDGRFSAICSFPLPLTRIAAP